MAEEVTSKVTNAFSADFIINLIVGGFFLLFYKKLVIFFRNFMIPTK